MTIRNKNNANPILDEIFLFRPSAVPVEGTVIATSGYEHKGHGLLRYADGRWIPDDGEPDLAFVEGVIAFGVHLPHSTNIIWQWRDLELSRQFVSPELHRNVTGWHYQTINSTRWQDNQWDYKERDEHPNGIAFKSAMDTCCSFHGCANGRGPDLTQMNPWIERGLLMVKSTMQIIKPPDNPVCYLCLDNGKGHLLEALISKESDLEAEIEDCWRLHNKAELDAYDYKNAAESAEDNLKAIQERITSEATQ